MATNTTSKPAPRKTTTATAKKAVAAGGKVPSDFLATIRAHVPDYVYETTFGEVRLPGYLPTGMIMDNAGLSEGEMFTKLIAETTDEDSLQIIRALPQDDFDGIEGSLMGLMRSWFAHQGVDMGESSASSD